MGWLWILKVSWHSFYYVRVFVPGWIVQGMLRLQPFAVEFFVPFRISPLTLSAFVILLNSSSVAAALSIPWDDTFPQNPLFYSHPSPCWRLDFIPSMTEALGHWYQFQLLKGQETGPTIGRAGDEQSAIQVVCHWAPIKFLDTKSS